MFLNLGHEPEFTKFRVDVFFEGIGQFVILRVWIVVRSTVGNDSIEIGDEEARMNVVTVL